MKLFSFLRLSLLIYNSKTLSQENHTRKQLAGQPTEMNLDAIGASIAFGVNTNVRDANFRFVSRLACPREGRGADGKGIEESRKNAP